MITPPEDNNIEFSRTSAGNLNIARKWAMFLAVVGFILFGLMIIFGLITGTFLSAFRSEDVTLGLPEYLLLVFFLVVSAVFFSLVLFLFRFSKSARDAVQKHDRKKLEKAFKYLRIFFTLAGILVIAALAVYLVSLIVSGASLSFLNGSQ